MEGAVHLSWTNSPYETRKRYIVHYSLANGVQIDSLDDLNSKISFMSNGEVRLYKIEHKEGIDSLVLYISKQGRVIKKIKTDVIPKNVSINQILLDLQGDEHLLLQNTNDDKGLFVMKYVGTDSAQTFLIAKGYTAGTTSFVDSTNSVWITGVTNAKNYLLNFSLNSVAGFRDFYFPLQVGNEWYYQQYSEPPAGTWPTEHIVKATRETTMPNKRTYIEISSKDWGKRFWRNDGLKVFQYLSNDSTEFVRFDFTKAVRETIATRHVDNQLRSIVIDSIYYRKVLGMNYFNFRFMGDVSNDKYGGSGVDVCDSIGINHFGLMGPETFLIGAKINGKTYGTVLSVENKTSLPPNVFSLSQNYPKPFNPTTTINYQLPTNIFTTLKVYDLLGREVAVLVNEVKDAGTYSVQWNASQFSRSTSRVFDQNAGGLASGVYFVKISAGNYSATKKILLMK